MIKSLIERLSRAARPYRPPYNLDLLVGNKITLFANSPLYWTDRTVELRKLVSFQPQNTEQAERKHADLLAVIEDLKTERKSYQSTKSKLADAELIKLSLLAAKDVRALRDAYPSLSADKAAPIATTNLRETFASVATKTKEWADTVRANPHVQKTLSVTGKILKAAGTRIANDLSEISAPLRQNFSDAVQDTKIVIRENLNAIPLVRNIDWSNPKHRRITTNAASYVAIFGLAAGVVSHMTSHEIEKSAEPETKPITFKFEEPRIAKSNDDIFARPVLKDGGQTHKTYKYVTKPQKAAPVYASARKSFSDDDFYSFDESDNEAHKKLKGHKLSGWNWDALLKPKYRNVIVRATEKLLAMSPSEVFHKGLLMTESGGRQFDKHGNVVTSSAGATGAAQVMPDTARAVAPRCTGDNIDWNRFKTDRDYNIKVGKCYFHEQHETFGNNNVAALLAYNGGPGSDTMRAGLKYNIRKAGISLSNDGEKMVELISSIRNTENRHYTLITMAKLGLLDPNELGNDVTNGDKSSRYEPSARKATRSYHWEVEPEKEQPTIRYEFQHGAQDLKSSEINEHKQRESVLATSADPIGQAATLD